MTTRISEPDEKRRFLFDEAKALGFDAVGVCAPGELADARSALARFVALGRHGAMDWMARRLDERGDPRTLWPETRSVVMVAANYGPAIDPMTRLSEKEHGVVSVYAQGADYHDVLKKRLKRLGRSVAHRFGCQLKVFVDTAPVMEKPLAEAAGLGWRGKHTNLVSRHWGSWLFLGAMYLDEALPADARETDHCGNCRACLDVCPTDAFPAPYELDARRCLSYLTIEHKGPWPLEFREAVGNRIYGCDDCLAVCPWNKFAKTAQEAAFHARVELQAPRLDALAALDEPSFREMFAGSPIKRIGRDRFVRNVLYAIGASGRHALTEAARARLDDGSALVRGAAVWACRRLLTPEAFEAERTQRLNLERDPQVREEWGLQSAKTPA